jgi:septal ring factor EnvC (AmiA/AmiB activator)
MDGDSMKNDKKSVTFFKQKSYLLAAGLMLAAVLGMTGVYVAQQGAEKQEEAKLESQVKEQLQQQHDQLAEKEAPKTAAVDRVIRSHNDDFLDEPAAISPSNDTLADKEEEEKDAEEQESEDGKEEQPQQEPVAETSATPKQPELHFDAANMGWPLQGKVLMSFNKEQTVYFETLNQFKINDALIIQGELNAKVSSVADGVVSNIEYDNEETGCTVTIDLGDGYSAVYGQLQSVPLSAGDYVEAGAAVGYLSNPTKYYGNEGPNLFFQMIKDNETIDPMEFLQQE